jgi:acyl-CoA thioester hydrolase
MKPASETRIRVRYAETDQMGVAYYANYLVWMEVARGDLCKASGFNYIDMEQGDGVLMAVAEANCRYKYPARYDEEIAIKAWIAEANTKMVTIEYEMTVGERVLATGYTRHIYVSKDMQRVRLPEKYWPAFGMDQKGRT